MRDFNVRQKLIKRGSGYLVYIPKDAVPNGSSYVYRYLTKNRKVILEFM